MERKQISYSLRFKVWTKYHGSSSQGSCYTGCKKILNFFEGFECGHVISVKNGGPTELDNLKPICQECNREMSSMNMTDFIRNKGYKPLDTSIYDLPYMDIEFYGTQCESILRNGQKCRNEKKYGDYCGIHRKKIKT